MGSNCGYRDVTREWLNNANPNSHRVFKRKYYLYKKMKYKIDGKLVVLNYSQDEYETAVWLKKTFGGKIYINPQINYPKGIKTADYLWQDELWDKKSMKGSTSEYRAVHNAIKQCRDQSSNFIIDISGCVLSNQVIINQVKNLFNSNDKSYLDWLEKIIIVRNNILIKVIVKNRRRP